MKLKSLVTVLSTTFWALSMSLPASAQVYVNGIRVQGQDLYSLQQFLGHRVPAGNYVFDFQNRRLYPLNQPSVPDQVRSSSPADNWVKPCELKYVRGRSILSGSDLTGVYRAGC